MTSAWQRLKPIFDRIPDAAFFSDGQRLVKEYVGEFSGRGDGASLAALYLELPFYISGRFSGDEAESDKLSFMRAFEDAIASADPSVQEVLQLKRELDNRGIYNARLAVTYCKQAIDQEDLAYMTTLWGEGMKTAIVDENGLQLQAAGGF